MPRPKIASHISQGGKALTELMKDKLAVIGHDLIDQLISKARRVSMSQRPGVVKDINPRGVLDYKDALKNALSVIASYALKQVRTEIPKAKNVKLTEDEDSLTLAEFDKLPAGLRKKITLQTELLVGKQVGDLRKVIEFAYLTAEDETDSLDQVEQDLNESAIGWLDGTAVSSGADLTSATIINSARSAFFFESDVLEQIEAFVFNNSDPVSEICQDLAGTVFSKEEATTRYFPPLHWNCKSFITPVLTGNLDKALKKAGQEDLEPLKPSTAKLDAQVQFSEESCSHSNHHSH